MSANSFGTLYKLTSFGESHGKAVGGIIEGILPGLEIDMEFIQAEMNRRRPGQSAITTPRDEKDQVEILSGVFDGKATGGEHSAIADAIAKGDGEAAAKAVRTHIESLRTRLMRAQDVNRGRGPMPRPR